MALPSWVMGSPPGNACAACPVRTEVRRRPRGPAPQARRPQGCRPLRTGPSARRRACARVVDQGGMVLGVGIDWAEEFHLVALGRPGEGVIAVRRVEHTPAAVEGLLAEIASWNPTRPRSVSWWRPATACRSSGWSTPALWCCRSTPTSSPGAAAPRARRTTPKTPASAACWRLTATPACGRWCPTASWPASRARSPATSAARRPCSSCCNAGPPTLGLPPPAATSWSPSPHGPPRLAGAAGRPGPGRAAHRPLHRAGLPGAGLADTIRLAAAQLLLIAAQRRAWERRMGALLLGAPRYGRAKQPRAGEVDQGQAFPGGEIGDHPEQFGSPNALACYAGKAPVTRRSGKHELVVACRLACNRHLAAAVQQWAFCSLQESGWARPSTTPSAARQDPPGRPQGAGQPLAGGPVALPAHGRPLRRGRPRRQPPARPRQGRLTPWLTKGVSPGASGGRRQPGSRTWVRCWACQGPDHAPQQRLGDLLAAGAGGVQLREEASEHDAGAAGAGRALGPEAAVLLAEAGQEYAGKADDPRAVVPAGLLDQRNPRQALHGGAACRVEQDRPQAHEPDGVGPQADGAAIQGKRLWAGGKQAEGRLVCRLLLEKKKRKV